MPWWWACRTKPVWGCWPPTSLPQLKTFAMPPGAPGPDPGSSGAPVKRPPDRRLVALLAVAISCLQRQYRDPAVVVDQSVRAARELGREPAGPVCQRLLRRVLADPDAAQADLSEPMAQFNVPLWWHDRLVADWGLPQAHAILRASQARPPLCLRLMGTKVQQQDTQARMRASGLQVHVHPEDAACVWAASSATRSTDSWL